MKKYSIGFTARSMYFLTANVVQTAIAKADSFRDSILELQQKYTESLFHDGGQK